MACYHNGDPVHPNNAWMTEQHMGSFKSVTMTGKTGPCDNGGGQWILINCNQAPCNFLMKDFEVTIG